MKDIKKNALEIIRVQRREYKGREFVDIRVHYQDDEGEYKPTKKGITINPGLVGDLMKALEEETKQDNSENLDE